MSFFPCPLCDHIFTQRIQLERHLNRSVPCVTTPTQEQAKKLRETIAKYTLRLGKSFKCNGCDYESTRSDSLKRHIESGSCPLIYKEESEPDQDDTPNNITTEPKPSSKQVINQPMTDSDVNQRLRDLEQHISSISQSVRNLETCPKVSNNYNNFNVVCVDPTKDLMRELADRMTFRKALNFIKDCALVLDASSDSHLLERIYMTDLWDVPIPIVPIRFKNSKGLEVEYIGPENIRITETTISFRNKLIDSLKDCYSKAYSLVQLFRDRVGKFPYDNFDDSDMIIWGQHMANLTDDKYKNKVIKKLSFLSQSNQLKSLSLF